MPDDVFIVVKIRVPRVEAYTLKEELQENLEDFFLADNVDTSLDGIEIEEVK
jgi:hypothetical protein